MDIIIFGGQSNMKEQTECLSENKVVENAFEYKFLSDSFVPLKNPVGEDIGYDFKETFVYKKDSDFKTWIETTALGSACYGYTNMVPQFCRKYIEITGEKILAVHAAKGSTMVKEWLPPDKRFEVFIRKLTSAKEKLINKGETIGKIYFVWLQGESDAIFETSKAEYKEMLTKLNLILKENIGINKFGIIRVGRFTNDSRDDEIINAQSEICNENEDFLMLTEIATELNKQKEYMNPEVAGHYSAKGLEKLGFEAAKTLGNYRIK